MTAGMAPIKTVEAPSDSANAGSTVADDMNARPTMKSPKSAPSASRFQRRFFSAKLWVSA